MGASASPAIGIGVIGVFTATVASYVLAQDEEDLAARLDALGRTINLLLERQDAGTRAPGARRSSHEP